MKTERQPVSAGTGNAGECYAARLDEATPDRMAWLRVDGKRESLHVRDTDGQTVWTADWDTYVADHCIAGGELFWARMDALRTWSLRTTNGVVPTHGRAMSLSSRGDLLVWEEREGKRTRVRLMRVDEGVPGEPVDVTNGSSNAYDPVVTRLADGTIAVLFCGFGYGNYRIYLQRLTAALTINGDPVLLSDQLAPCLYPSVWPDGDGGLWYSYTSLDVPTDRRVDLASLLLHPRHQAQRNVFRWRGRAYVGQWRQGQTWSPIGSPGNQGIHAGMVVYPSVGAAHTRVFQTPDGLPGLLMRQHAPGLKHPHLSLSELGDQGWADPKVLAEDLNRDAPISMSLRDRRLTVAYDETLRQTGWGKDAEYFHADARVGVGTLTITLDQPCAEIEFRPYVIHPHQGNDLANPRLARRDADGFLQALGQTHTHSDLSVCCREIDRDGHFNYRFLQDVMHCDFGAVTDHAYNMTDFERLLTRKLAEFYYFPGEFVAIPAYEWTGSGINERGGPWGHVNPLWLEEDGDLEFYTPVDAACAGSDLKKLARAHAGQHIIAPPHHPADSLHPYKWEDWDEALSPVVEIFQDCRGSGEQPWAPGVTHFLRTEEDHWIVDWLKQGLRLGFIAGGDHTGISLAGVLVKELTRSGLYEAFAARRTFATTGIPAKVTFSANGLPMGTAVNADSANFQLAVETPEPIAEVQILRDGETVESKTFTGNRIDHQWTTTPERPGEFWYVRILLQNGEIIWTSPIWL